jgi:membrane-bound metal-dependent hydrolase YbcI (DUF457 family)
MASPVGHVMVGFASAAVAARVVGEPLSPQLWFGAFVAAGLPDLDYALMAVGLRGPHIHRNASHSLLVIAVLVLAAWFALPRLPIAIPDTLLLVWTVALLSHPLVDLITCGPVAAGNGYGIALLWPLSRKRWSMERPLLETADFEACRSVRDVWVGVLPEIVRLGPASAVVLVLALLI